MLTMLFQAWEYGMDSYSGEPDSVTADMTSQSVVTSQHQAALIPPFSML